MKRMVKQRATKSCRISGSMNWVIKASMCVCVAVSESARQYFMEDGGNVKLKKLVSHSTFYMCNIIREKGMFRVHIYLFIY